MRVSLVKNGVVSIIASGNTRTVSHSVWLLPCR